MNWINSIEIATSAIDLGSCGGLTQCHKKYLKSNSLSETASTNIRILLMVSQSEKWDMVSTENLYNDYA